MKSINSSGPYKKTTSEIKSSTQSKPGQEERYKKRETGARKIRHAQDNKLFSMRRLEVDDIG